MSSQVGIYYTLGKVCVSVSIGVPFRLCLCTVCVCVFSKCLCECVFRCHCTCACVWALKCVLIACFHVTFGLILVIVHSMVYNLSVRRVLFVRPLCVCAFP